MLRQEEKKQVPNRPSTPANPRGQETQRERRLRVDGHEVLVIKKSKKPRSNGTA